MERALHWILVLIVSALFIIINGLSHSRLVAAENYERADRMLANIDGSGFISIDCGSSRDHRDEETGIWYQTDKNFVETGKGYMVPGGEYSEYPYFGKQLNTLRCFPEGERNCYTLRPEHGKNNRRYFIRAFFSYGNYDGKNQTPSFELHLGVNLWEKVSLGQVNSYHIAESIHSPSSDSIQVCLVKTGSTIPCISALELRPLDTSIYPVASSTTAQPLLNLQGRFDIGSLESSTHTRYKDDVYDRIWRNGKDVEDGWYLLNISSDIDPGTKYDAYKLPAQVWRTAAQTGSVSGALVFDYNSLFLNLNESFKYCIYLHFAEIEKLPAGKMRIINTPAQPLPLEYLKPVTFGPAYTAQQGYIHLTISAAPESGAPPILNALEIYQLITQLDSPTKTRDDLHNWWERWGLNKATREISFAVKFARDKSIEEIFTSYHNAAFCVVDAMVDIKSAYRISRLNWQGDPCLPRKYAWDGLICSNETRPRIISLNLSSSKLTGEIHISFSHLTQLEFLDLSNNELLGPLPEFLTELSKLKVLNLTGNKLSGSIPKALKEKATTTLQLSVAGNPNLCMKDSYNKKNFVVQLAASLPALIVILLIFLGFWIFKRRRKVEEHIDSKKGISLESKHQTFNYIEILNITDNLKTNIGEGGFGKVYLGILQDHTQVAVKLLSSSSRQGYREFQSEVQLHSLIRHRNLVSLIGYCDEGEIKALIYEYMANGSLQQHLSKKNPNVLNWNERLNIAIDAVNGLDYLHNGCKPPIVHRDLKTSNILLDQYKHAKIADFGLSRAFHNDIDSHISTHPAGTPGYIDPEFHRTGKLNKKSDVYSVGIILLELVTAQPAIARVAGEAIHILQWVTPIVERGDIQNIVDPRLQGEFNTNSVKKVVEIALSCTSPIAAVRPDISQIFVELKECLSMEIVDMEPKKSIQLETEFSLSPR